MVEANHRIANSLSIIASLIHFQVEGLPADGTVPATDVRNWLQELEAKVETIADLHRLLISSQKSEAIDLGAYLRNGFRQVADAHPCDWGLALTDKKSGKNRKSHNLFWGLLTNNHLL